MFLLYANGQTPKHIYNEEQRIIFNNKLRMLDNKSF